MNMLQRIFEDPEKKRVRIDEIKRQNMELFTSQSLKKSELMNDHLRKLSIPILKKIAISLNKDKSIENQSLIEYVLNELENRIGHEGLKAFCAKM